MKKKFFYCGIFHVKYPFKFEVIKVLRGSYSEQQIRIEISCPLEAIEFGWLKNNKIYEFTLRKAYFIEMKVLKMTHEAETDYYEILLSKK